MSVVASSVIVEPLSISAITGVVSVLFVNVSVAVIKETVPVKSGIVTVLSAVGSVATSVVSKLSAVEPSKTKPVCKLTVELSTVVVEPDTVKLPAIVTFAPDMVIAVVVPDFIIKLPPVFVNEP